MGFDIDRFMAWKPTEADKARSQAEWRGIIAGLSAAQVSAALVARMPKQHKPRKGSKAEQFLSLLAENPDMPAARINALLPEPMDESTARRLARRCRGF